MRSITVGPLFFIFFVTFFILAGGHTSAGEAELFPIKTKTYAGQLPTCHNCPGAVTVLTLFEDRTYRMAVRNPDTKRQSLIYELGTWARAMDDGNYLRLRSGLNDPCYFSFADGDKTLHPLDVRMKKIVTKEDYALQLQHIPQFLGGPMALQGMLTYADEKAVIRECQTEKVYPLLSIAKPDDLKNAVDNVNIKPGVPLFVTFTGRFVLDKSGEGMTQYIELDSVDKSWPDLNCASASQAPFFNTKWEVSEVDYNPVTVTNSMPAPHLIFQEKDKRVIGFSGCNRIMGSFEAGEGSALILSQMAGTRRACIPPFGEEEKRFLDALVKVRGMKITGKTLLLLDTDNKVIVELKAK